MNTPISDFVNSYAGKATLRLHMPGHKGIARLGCEHLDITEIPGADCLHDAAGIIGESEKNAGQLFGASTYYSAEGSSLSIRTMVALAVRRSIASGMPPLIWAARNVHYSFVSAAALMDCSVEWLYPKGEGSYLSCIIRPEELEELFRTSEQKPCAVYITSPDYLGAMADIKGLASVCHAHNTLLLVDNAHGAYLKFLPTPCHPIDLGADICCDSAHKTLPVLSGGAYLHVSRSCNCFTEQEIRETMKLFSSTSPSYLILQSLDMANKYLAEDIWQEIYEFVPRMEKLRRRLQEQGYTLYGDELLKLTISTKPYGYYGYELAGLLDDKGIVVEFADPDYTVMMLSPLLSEHLELLQNALLSIKPRSPIIDKPPGFYRAERVLSLREAAMAPFIELPLEECEGRIMAQASVSCPPAVPILVGGERIDKEALACFKYYGVETCKVIHKA